MQRMRRIAAHVSETDVSTTSGPPSLAACSASGKPLVVTIIAAGNSGHVCAALFEENTRGVVRTQVLTSRPQLFENRRPVVRFPNGALQTGHLYQVSDVAAELIPNSDIVLWTGPVTYTQDIFASIAPHVNVKKTVVGTIFAQGLAHLLAQRVFGADVRFFALRNIPWLCRTVTPGRESEIVGGKTSVGLMAMNLDEKWCKNNLEPLFVMQKVGRQEPVLDMLPDFCPIVFNPANQIIHPARYWGLFRNFNGQPLAGDKEPNEWLYRGMDEVAGAVLETLDEELQQLKNAYYKATGAKGCERVIPLRDRLLDQYGDQIADTSTLAKMVGTNKAYSMAKTPVIRTESGVMPNFCHRVVTDDIGWGLCPLISVAERLEAVGINTPTTMMRMLVEWHQKLMGKEFLQNGRLCGRDVAELVLLRPDDPLELVANPH